MAALMDFCKFCSNIVQVNSFCKCRFSSCYLPLTKVNATQPQNVPDVEELTQAPAPGKARQCHRLPICFLTSDLTIRNKNKRTLIVRRAGLSNPICRLPNN